MKPTIATNSRQTGSVLVLTLLVCLTVGIGLASFLTLISARNKMTVRSTAWNSAIPVLEAGIEEALTHLQRVKTTGPAANGWSATTMGGQPVHVKKRDLPDGSYYNVTIYNAAGNSPVIYSQGFVPSPLEKKKYISRLVRVGATNPPTLFNLGIATSGKINLTGNTVVDGYDSSKGAYNTISNRSDVGGMATASNDPNAVSVGNAHVFGKVITGPTGTISVGNGGAIGDVSWNASSSGIQPGWTNNDMNISFPTNSLIPGGPFLAPVEVTGGGSNLTFLATGTNQMSSYKSTSEKKVMIVTGKATLYISGDLDVSGTGYIQIMPGASLTVYVGGSAKFSGGGIVNPNGGTTNFTFIGLSSNKSVEISGGASFYGTINAPNADIKMSGSGDFYGAVIGKTYTAVGSAGFHYDKTLAQQAGFLVNSWKEL